MSDELAGQPAEAPPPPGISKVEITIGGHTISVESPEPLSDVAGYAFGLYEQTKEAAKKIPLGFDISGGLFERAEPYVEPTNTQEADCGGGLGRQQSQDGTTRRLVFGDPAGRHRARLAPLPMVPGRAAVPRPRN